MQDAANRRASGKQLALQQLTPDHWLKWRLLRLQALSEAPHAFGSKLADWQGTGDSEERWRERLSSVTFNLTAVLNDSPAGMVSATFPDRNGIVELISMWVTPSVRGCGVGDALIGSAIQWAERLHARCVSLDVIKGNEHAAAFYLRDGFTDVDELPRVSPEDESERRFIRNFAP